MHHFDCCCFSHVLLFLFKMMCLKLGRSLCYAPHGPLARCRCYHAYVRWCICGKDSSSCLVPDTFYVHKLDAARTVWTRMSLEWKAHCVPHVCYRCCHACVKWCACMMWSSSCQCGATSQGKPVSFLSWVSVHCTKVWPSVPGWWPQLILQTR